MDTTISSKQMLGKLLFRHYEEAFAAKAAGELVAWSTSIDPQEL